MSNYSLYIELLRSFFESVGYEPEYVEDICGIEPTVGVDKSVDTHSYVQVLSAFSNVNYDQEKLFKLAKTVPVTIHSPLALGLVTAPNLYEGLQFGTRFASISANIVRMSCEVEEKTVSIVVSSSLAMPYVDNLVTDLMFCIYDQYISIFTQNADNAQKIEIVSTDKDKKQIFERVFGCEVELGCDVNRFVFNKKLLFLKSPLSDYLTFQSENKKCVNLYDISGESFDIIRTIRELILLSISDPPDVKNLANSLNISVRQLRYLLERKGRSYQDLVKECKLETAKKLLSNESLQLSEVGYQIGYADVSNFSGAFKKWTGVSPKAYRKKLLEGAV